MQDQIAEVDTVEELRRRVAELTEEVRARDAFIAFAAHEIRNPITPLVGQIELLLLAVRSGRCALAQVEQRLMRIERILWHYVKRVTVLLDVSRITKGNLQLELSSFDLGLLLREVADRFAAEVLRAGCGITLTLPDSLQGVWDRVAVEQIINNLISNALRYGARTPVELSAQVCGEHVLLRVRDYGSGIPAQERARIFGRFEHALQRSERRSGFGVGLWVVCQLANAMGGTVAVEDALGGGALLTVTLPRHVTETRS